MISTIPITASGIPTKAGITAKLIPLAKLVESEAADEFATPWNDHTTPTTVIIKKRPPITSVTMPALTIQVVARVLVSSDVVPTWYGFEVMVPESFRDIYCDRKC